tara:strand:- start:13395 stop:13769 length:375 start_codon:yes stop_codon:yes gene_type:complete
MSSLTADEEQLVKTNVARWLEMKKTIKDGQKKIREMKDAQKLVENEIIRIMEQKDIPNFNLGTGSLKLKEKQSKKAIPPKWIKEKLNTVVDSNDAEATKVVMDEILTEMENPPTTVKKSLVHSK